MSDLIPRLTQGLESEAADRALLRDAIREVTDLRHRCTELEEILIILARTGFPWDEDGKPSEAFPAFRERYQRLMHEAADLLGLELRSMINRTEPRT